MSLSRHSMLLLAMAFAVIPFAPASAQTTPVNPPVAPAAATTAPAPAPAAPAAAAAASAAGQAGIGSFGAFSKNSGKPIDIESDVLVVHDQQKYATFKGNVKAVQGTTTLRSNELDVHYSGSGSDSLTGAAPKDAAPAAAPPAAGTAAGAPNAAAPAANAVPSNQAASADPKPAGGTALGGGGNQITKIEARGNVIITSDQDQTTTGDWALDDVPAQLMTVGGNVVLTQGKNVLKGDRLVIDLKTGESRFENTGNGASGGKIRALFMPSQDTAAKDGKSGNGQTAKDTSSTTKPAADTAVKDSAAPEVTAPEVAAPQPLFPGMPQ
ncbi:MAG: LptA/OstA family protein [Methyloceanibacter sp.]|jgi:lipopolysaccharide export system protein LptA